MIKKAKIYLDKKRKTGFTLIETLVAITVLLLSILGPLEIASKALFSAFYSRDEITASYLAAEAIEYIKNARDTNALINLSGGTPVEWLDGLRECVEVPNTSKGCIIDAILTFKLAGGAEIVPCPLTGCPALKFDSSASGLWGYTLGADSRFTRTVEIVPQTNAALQGEAMINVTVAWQGTGTFGGVRQVTLHALMTDFHNR